MRHRSFIAVAVVLGALVVAVVGVLVLDSRANGHIANGVRVGGVDVGGMTRAQATAALRRHLLEPLRTPIVVRHGSRVFHLSAREARIRANLAGMVDAAIARGHDGSPLTRAWRELTGGRVNASLPGRVSFSHAAVVRLVTRVEEHVNRKPVDASVDFSGGSVRKTPSRSGVAVEAQRLDDAISAAVARPHATRTFVAQTRRVPAQVTSRDLDRKYPTLIYVNRSAFRLTLYKHLHVVRTYPVAVGQQGLETPAGLYRIQDKQVNPSWHVPDSAWAGKLAGKVIPPGPQDPIKARWMGFYNGAGIHGTDELSSIGTAASHGCIRMFIPDVIDLYDRVPLGSPIYVA